MIPLVALNVDEWVQRTQWWRRKVPVYKLASSQSHMEYYPQLCL